uniref:Uncharacterized protein n=1 Tax=Cacopsylla melanoneura TaxID=428564 RepID=A0A8D9E9R3_9HEMI
MSLMSMPTHVVAIPTFSTNRAICLIIQVLLADFFLVVFKELKESFEELFLLDFVLQSIRMICERFATKFIQKSKLVFSLRVSLFGFSIIFVSIGFLVVFVIFTRTKFISVHIFLIIDCFRSLIVL